MSAQAPDDVADIFAQDKEDAVEVTKKRLSRSRMLSGDGRSAIGGGCTTWCPRTARGARELTGSAPHVGPS